MKKIEIYLKILDIKRRLLMLLNSDEYSYQRLYALYREYLQLVVQIQNCIPSYKKWSYENNCYFYSLDLPTPNIFYHAASKLDDALFSTNVGNISGRDYLIDDNFCTDTILEAMYADLDILNIRYFPSAINLPPKHNGYKIAIFVDEDGVDYHFARQNGNGKWSQKNGYCYEFYYGDNPMDLLNDEYSHYEYIKTLEIVKPTIKR